MPAMTTRLRNLIVSSLICTSVYLTGCSTLRFKKSGSDLSSLEKL